MSLILMILLFVWIGPSCAIAQSLNPLPPGNITIVVPLAAGGPADATARILAEALAPRIQRTLVVENRIGAGGNIGAAFVSRSQPDGLTWLYTFDSVFTSNPYLYASQGFDPKDLSPVTKVGEFVLTLVVKADKIPAKSFGELVELSKTRELSFASGGGVGSPGHLAFAYMRSVSGMRGVHVPYRGASQALTDMIAGNVDGGFVVTGVVAPHVKSGALRALAVSANKRIPELPGVPTSSEAGIPNFEARFANLLMTQSRVKPEVRAFINQNVAAAMSLPEVRQKFLALSTDPIVSTEQEAIGWIEAERGRWGKIIKSAGIKAE